MARLKIKTFSCIDFAEVEMTPLTIIIGPQASGKSVISKLFYFFIDRVNGISRSDFPETDYESTTQDYIDETIDEFKKSFPHQAWGNTAFSLCFESGPAEIRIWRSKPRKNSVGNVQCVYSQFLLDAFEDYRKELRSVYQRIEERREDAVLVRNWELTRKFRKIAREKMQRELGDGYISTQFFIPAGRSFFTSMGKAVVAFEHGGFLDPLTISFGKTFLAMRESPYGRGLIYRRGSESRERKELVTLQENLMEQLFFGKIIFERNDEYIQASDGRKIPFAIMSSGQQELLPLWVTLNGFLESEINNSLIYVEEPEAHLFPTAQGIITQYIATLLSGARGQKFLITTHSPYILAKLNNLMKAGNLSSEGNKKTLSEIDDVVPRQAWLRSGTVNAYAIIGRRVTPIIDDGGLIDAEYLDGVSGEISRDFNRLLEIEYAR